MPKQTNSNIIGRRGERWFQNQLPSEWVFQTPSEDIGVDGLVVVLDEGEINGIEFRVQIKSSANFKETHNEIKISGIKRSTLLYWIHNPTPTLLVAYNDITKIGYCGWIDDILYDSKSTLSLTKELISFSIPKDKPIISDIWDEIRKDLKQFRRSLKSAYFEREYTFPYSYRISDILLRLNMNETMRTKDGSEFTQSQLQLLWTVELKSYEDFYLLLIEIEKNIHQNSPFAAPIKTYKREFKKICDTFFFNFDEVLSNNEGEIQVGLKVKTMIKQRAILRDIMLLTLNLLLKRYEKKTSNAL